MPAHQSAQEMIDEFASFFNTQGKVIYGAFGLDSDHAAPPPVVLCSHNPSQFHLLSLEEVVKVINNAPQSHAFSILCQRGSLYWTYKKLLLPISLVLSMDHLAQVLFHRV